MKKIRLRLGLIVFGTFLALCVLEIALQLGHLYAVAKRQSTSPSAETGLRILCLGESTTESGGWQNPSSWPKQLEAKLRATFSVPVTVYNRGVVGTNSERIRTSLPTLLQEIKPHLVLTMIGINDDLNVLIYETSNLSRVSPVLAHSRLYRFVRMLLRTRTAPSAIEATPDSSELQALLRRKSDLQTAGNRLALISTLEDLAERDPSTPIYYYGLLQDMLFRPLSSEDFSKLYSVVTGQPAQTPISREAAEKIEPLLEASSLDPLSKLQAQVEIARARRDINRLGELLSRQTEPTLRIYSQAQVCRLQGRAVDQETITTCWDALRPLLQDRPVLRRATGLYHIQRGSFTLASRFLGVEEESKLSRENSRSRSVVLGHKALALWMSGDRVAATRLFQIYDEYRSIHPAAMTLKNYPAIVHEIKETGARVFAIQYPLLGVYSLKALLAESPPDGFIDQEMFFKEHIIKQGYNSIFYDAFAGAFGHTRALGNTLIAENIFAHIEPILKADLALSTRVGPEKR